MCETDISALNSAKLDKTLLLNCELRGTMDAAYSHILAQDMILSVIRDDMKKSFEILQRTIVSINQRTCPTVFILLPKSREGKDVRFTWLERMKLAAESIAAIASDPTGKLTDSIKSICQDTNELALVCEVCRLPMTEKIYPIKQPAPCITKWLPMIKTGLHFISLANNLAKLGTSLGIPSIDTETMRSLKSFVRDISNGSR